MKLYYRISNQSYDKPKIPGSNKEVCLMNFVRSFSDIIFPEGPETKEPPVKIIADRCDRKTTKMIQSSGLPMIVTDLGNAGSLKATLELAIKENDENELIYLSEDDYLHLGTSPVLLKEGIKQSEYVTLYDHPDKYTRHYDGGEVSKVIKTASSHWRYTASTCMTFGAKVKTLKEDMDVWEEFTSDSHPHDHLIFTKLRENKRKIAVCIPGAACHTDLNFFKMVKQILLEPWAIEMMIHEIEEKIKEKTQFEYKKMVENKKGWPKLIALEAIYSSIFPNKRIYKK